MQLHKYLTPHRENLEEFSKTPKPINLNQNRETAKPGRPQILNPRPWTLSPIDPKPKS